MKHWAAVLFLTLSLIAVPASAHADDPPPPVIDDISGTDGLSIEGGDLIEILGSNLVGAGFKLQPSVSFRTSYADFCCTYSHGEIVEASDTQLLVRTPRQASGWTDLVVRNRADAQTVVPHAVHFGRSGFTRVLVPIAFRGEVPGALGSRWVTELGGLARPSISDEQGIEVTRRPFAAPTSFVRGGFTFEDLPTDGGGMFLYVEEQSDLALNLRIRDVSRGDQNLGTEIPLVTAEETATAYGVYLSNIPVESKYRLTLRVYNFQGRRAAMFRVYVQAHSPEATLLSDRTYEMAEESFEEFPTRPGYVEINLSDSVPANFSGPIDVRIGQNLLPTARLWAMVSITNNQTQLVTTVTPSVREHHTAVVIQ